MCLGQYRDEIVSKVNAIPNFLNDALVKNLRDFTILPDGSKDNSSSFLSALDLRQFGNYLKTKTKDTYESLDKIAEATGQLV